MIKLTIVAFLLFHLLSLSNAYFNVNQFYYNEDQETALNTGTQALNGSPDPTISIIDTNNIKTPLSLCRPLPHNSGGANIIGPFYCPIPKNLTTAEPIIANYLYPKGATLTSGGDYDSNKTIGFVRQSISSTIIDLKNKTITINGDALLPKNGIATKENGMSIIAKFNNASVIDDLNCTVVDEFTKWVCTTNYPQYLSKEFQITYTYQYPTQLNITTITAIPPPETPTPSPSSSNSLKSIISFPLLLTPFSFNVSLICF
ncbi:hypothetical protein ACTA71_000797 [Dictyostelium dimigraforme]